MPYEIWLRSFQRVGTREASGVVRYQQIAHERFFKPAPGDSKAAADTEAQRLQRAYRPAQGGFFVRQCEAGGKQR